MKIKNMKKILFIVAVLIIASGAALFAIIKINEKNDTFDIKNYNKKTSLENFKSIVYYIDNKPVKIGENGLSYFGNEIIKDINNDGKDDIVFILKQNSDGSGIFYYATSAISNKNEYVGTNSIFLGDRIAPQSTEYNDNKIVINYADREMDKPMTTQPSIAVSRFFNIINSRLVEIVKNDINKKASVSLDSKTWAWVKTQYNDDKIIIPKQQDKFTITFKNSNLEITTDCNRGFGSYTLNNDNKITLGQLGATEMYCEGSQESEFMKMLSEINGYIFTDKGELVLDLKLDTGSMIFK